MQKIKAIDEMQIIRSAVLRDHMEKKAMELLAEYRVNNLDNIGCFAVLDAEEYPQFRMDEMEFVEVILLDNETYLHGVRIVSDGYGEDMYLPVERVMQWQS